MGMMVTLPSAMDQALELRARAAGFGSPEEFVRDALSRMLAEDSHHEAAVLEGLRGHVAPLNETEGLTAEFNFNIGGGGILDTGGNFFRGLIDHVAVFDKALLPAEVSAAYNSVLPAITSVSRSAADPVYEGSDVTFRAGVAGAGPFTYQWRKDGNGLTGETGAALTVRSVTAVTAGEYDVVVTGGGATLTSEALSLSVQAAPPTISLPPPGAVRFVNGSVRFSVTAVGTQPVAYRWKRGAEVIPGAADSTLSLTDLQASDAGDYTVTVTNPQGAVSATASLTVLTPAKLAATITDLGPLGYWRLDESSGTNAFDYWGGRDGGATAGVTNRPG